LGTAALALAGCWSVPVSIVPKGPPRVIQQGVVVEVAMGPAIVESVNPRTRTILLRLPGDTRTHAYRVAQRISNLDRIIVGDEVQAKLTEDLTVYVSRDGGYQVTTGRPGLSRRMPRFPGSIGAIEC
jgi:hypothetical protein